MTYSLVLPFDSDDPEFARGFEAGNLWERIKNDHTTWSAYIHATNAEMIMRMCESEGRVFSAKDVDDTFIEVTIK